ncbi:PREDICTED: uncharacterized protein LOC102843093 [Elephantulus edwardii]|uniref:uncharacterized protein LOC102843093 n=1 Tax=Elephantulus edwardii TaxID=28737 RepID=UPI0003F0B2A8|nr:PREDICTED: uncharacterized protein LOC102843093 [Elephantulus edwardii]
MAVEFGDQGSGFRHNEVIRFINNEVLSNGGGPDFYLAFRARPWNEVEDRLRSILADPQVPRPVKRACTWSALALGVRVAARQRDQMGRRIQRLQEQVQEREATSWTLASELQRVRGEREEAGTQLHFTRAALQQALSERDGLRARLCRMTSSAQAAPLGHEVVPTPLAEQHGAVAWPQHAVSPAEGMAEGAHSMLPSETQMAAPTAPAALLYVPASSPWAHTMQQQMPVQQPYQCQAPFPVAYPYSTPVQPGGLNGAVAAAAPVPQPLPQGVQQPGHWGACAWGSQEMAVPWNQSSYFQQQAFWSPQATVSLEDSKAPEEAPPESTKSDDVVDNAEKLKEMTPPEGNQDPSRGEGPKELKVTTLLTKSNNNDQEAVPEMPQVTAPAPQGASNSHSEEDVLEKFQMMTLLSAEKNSENPQGTATCKGKRSPGGKEGTKKPQPQGQKVTKQTKVKKGSESEQPSSIQRNWGCQWCRAVNFPWRTACYKCKRTSMLGD